MSTSADRWDVEVQDCLRSEEGKGHKLCSVFTVAAVRHGVLCDAGFRLCVVVLHFCVMIFMSGALRAAASAVWFML